MDRSEIIAGLESVAKRWIDIEYPIRVQAMNATLSAPNRFTEESLHFAINQQMNEINQQNLESWISNRGVVESTTVGVLNPGNVPFADLQDFLAIALSGCSYRGSVSSKSPFLLPAFVDDLKSELAALPTAFVARDEILDGAQKLIATGTEVALDWASTKAQVVGLSPGDVLLRGPGFGIGILDGNETEDELERLAEDILLHEGSGCRSVAIIWAPPKLEPDEILNSLAWFRGVFPAHSETSGGLEMQRAYLSALGVPHAYSDDKSFLISKGDPEVQSPGHIRWVEYDSQDVIDEWIVKHSDQIQVVVSRKPRETAESRFIPFGYAQRPALGWEQSGISVLDFLYS